MQRRSIAAGFSFVGILMLAAGFVLSDGSHAHALTNCDVADYSLDGEEQAFLGLINAYRAQNGLGALTVSPNLNRAAAWMVNDMASKNYFAHTDSLGRAPYQRAIDCGYPQGAGENLAAGTAWSTAQSALDAWKDSPGHNANMLTGYYQQIGIARVYNASSAYGWYWATEFGAIDDGSGGFAPPPTNTPTPRPANTPVPPTNTPKPQPTSPPAVQPTNTPPAAPTRNDPTTTPTPRSTNTAAPSPTNAAATKTATPAPTNTPTPAPRQSPAATPTKTPAPQMPLSRGANLVAWPSGNVTPGEALSGMSGSIAAVYSWDPATSTWKRYIPGLPSYLSNLPTLQQGSAYWVIARDEAQIPVRP